MKIQVTCACGRTLSVGAEHAGKTGKCPSCGAAIPIPAAQTLAEEELTLQAPEPAAAGVAAAPARLSQCAKCQAPVAGASDFCEACGAPVVAGRAGAAGKLCPHCLKLCPAEAMLCMHCNASLRDPNQPYDAGPAKIKGKVYTTAQPQGLALGKMIGWGIAAVFIFLLLVGGYKAYGYFVDMDFRAYIREGNDWLGKGYPGDAERAFNKAAKIRPGAAEVKQGLEDAEALRKLQDEMRMNGLSAGPMGHEAINRMRQMEKMREGQGPR